MDIHCTVPAPGTTVDGALNLRQYQNRAGNQTDTLFKLGEADVFSGIRCPLCAWHPDASSRWCCEASDAPEPFFQGCRTVWNTFSTRGRCPGCDHQWQWTSCLRCGGWSLHEDWYEEEQRGS